MNSKIQYKVCIKQQYSIVSYFSFRLFFFNKVISKLSNVILQLLFSWRPKIPLFGCKYYVLFYILRLSTYTFQRRKLSTDKWIEGQTGMQTFTCEIHKKGKEIFLYFENRNVGTQKIVSIYQELTSSSTFSRGHIQSKFGTTLATPSSPLKKYNISNLLNKIIYKHN